MAEHYDREPYEELANAIVLQAVKDYRHALSVHPGSKKYFAAVRTKEDCQGFFRSKWFKVLTTINPEYLIRKLDEEVES